MNQNLLNFKNLFSDDKKIVYQAILEKKDWINDVFYSDYSFAKKIENGKEIYEDLFSLLNNSLLLKDDKSENFAYRYFNKTKKYVKKEGHFLVGYDFSKLDIDSYKELFANFYPCIKQSDFVEFNDDIQNQLEKIMISDEDYVLILDKNNLFNNGYPIKVLCKIMYHKDYINEEKLEALKEIASTFDLEVEEIKDE